MILAVFRMIVCSSSFLYTFYVLCKFMYFLSNQCNTEQIDSNTASENRLALSTLWALTTDTCLTSVFILQHSIMASDFVKRIYHSLKIEDLERSIYNACSAAALHLMITFWLPASYMTLWDFTTTQNSKISLVMSAFHVLGWFIVYSGCLMMDISELVGIKQVIYKLTSRPCPMSMKSRDLRRYYSHMRHPSFSGFLLILWVHPFMSIDRVLLALILTVYMTMMWNIDQEDYRYHSFVIQRKERELS